MTFREFIKRFSTEEQCREYLFALRFPDGFVCPKCGHGAYWEVGGNLYTCKSCRHQTSVIAGTIFQDTRKPLMDWFIAIWWITTQKNGASALLGTHHGAIDEKHLQSYLDEYVFRFNRRKSADRGLLFYRLIESATRTKTITYNELIVR